MDIKSAIILEIKNEERVYRFEMPAGSSYGECYDAAFKFLGKVAQLAKEAADNMAKKDDTSQAQ